MNNKKLLLLSVFLSILFLNGCVDNNNINSSETGLESETEVSETEEVKEMITNLSFANPGYRNDGYLMGDIDGPAYCVYSKIGYNKASFEVDLGAMDINTVRKSDGRFINAYLILGCDIYDPTDEYWVNCIDAGIGFLGGDSGWHVFYSLYSTDDTFGGNKWYESNEILNPKHKYRIELDASKEDGSATLTVYDLNNNEKETDSVTLQLQYALKSGENIRFYQDWALDYPANTKFDTSKNPSENDWEEITLYNTDENLYLKNLRIKNSTLFNQDGKHLWTEEHTEQRGIWPDSNNKKLDYEVVQIKNPVFDHTYWIDFDMNRPEE